MINVDEYARACGVSRSNQHRKLGQHLAGVEQDLRNDHQIRLPDRRQQIGNVEQARISRLDKMERNPAAARVLPQNQIDRIELAARRDHARNRVVGVQDRPQTLPRTRLRHDAIRARGAEQLRKARAIVADFGQPVVPGIAQLRLPKADCLREVVSSGIEWPPQRVIGEVGAVAVGAEHARKKRCDMLPDALRGQVPRTERGNGVNDPARSFHVGVHRAPITVRTSISSGKKL